MASRGHFQSVFPSQYTQMTKIEQERSCNNVRGTTEQVHYPKVLLSKWVTYLKPLRSRKELTERRNTVITSVHTEITAHSQQEWPHKDHWVQLNGLGQCTPHTGFADAIQTAFSMISSTPRHSSSIKIETIFMKLCIHALQTLLKCFPGNGATTSHPSFQE